MFWPHFAISLCGYVRHQVHSTSNITFLSQYDPQRREIHAININLPKNHQPPDLYSGIRYDNNYNLP